MAFGEAKRREARMNVWRDEGVCCSIGHDLEVLFGDAS